MSAYRALLTAFASLLLASSALGQATFELRNHNTSQFINAPVFDAQGVALEGTNYLAELYGGQDPVKLTPAVDQVHGARLVEPFRVQGYFTPGFVAMVVEVGDLGVEHHVAVGRKKRARIGDRSEGDVAAETLGKFKIKIRWGTVRIPEGMQNRFIGMRKPGGWGEAVGKAENFGGVVDAEVGGGGVIGEDSKETSAGVQPRGGRVFPIFPHPCHTDGVAAAADVWHPGVYPKVEWPYACGDAKVSASDERVRDVVTTIPPGDAAVSDSESVIPVKVRVKHVFCAEYRHGP